MISPSTQKKIMCIKTWVVHSNKLSASFIKNHHRIPDIWIRIIFLKNFFCPKESCSTLLIMCSRDSVFLLLFSYSLVLFQLVHLYILYNLRLVIGLRKVNIFVHYENIFNFLQIFYSVNRMGQFDSSICKCCYFTFYNLLVR